MPDKNVYFVVKSDNDLDRTTPSASDAHQF